MCAYARACMSVYVRVFMCMWLRVCDFAYWCVHVFACMRVRLCARACTRVRV